MAITAGSLFNITATATTGNTGGAGFNPANANFPTDLTTNSNTANTSSPIVSSATYTFVAGDVGAAVYVKSGTNWTAGFYPIASVAGGKATLNAAIGSAWQLNTVTGFYAPSTVVGCATVGTPTAGTFGVNYAMLDTANSTITDAVSVGSSITLTSITAPWTPVSVGNFFHLTNAGTGGFGVVGWYEIVSYNSASSVVTDRTTNSGTALAAGTGQTGGAGRLNGLEDTFKTMLPASSMVWVKNGSYTFSGAATTASTNSTAALPSFFIGYNTVPGDTCTGSNRPLFILAANALTWCQAQCLFNIQGTTTAAAGFSMGANGNIQNCKFLNTSTTAGRAAVTMPNSNAGVIIGLEAVSQNGIAITSGASIIVYGSYLHDSATAVSTLSSTILIGNIFEANTTAAFTCTSASGNCTIMDCTIYGIETKAGIGINFSASTEPANKILNNIIYGLTTGINSGTAFAGSNLSQQNDFFNNTADTANWNKDSTDYALDPQFTGASQLTGTTATATGGTTTFTDSGASFGVTDNVDYLHITSVTGGVGTIVGCYLITGHTSTTLTTNNAIGTSGSITAIHYFVTHGHNFQIGTNLKGIGFPSYTNATGNQTTSYPDVGGVQRQESSGSGGGSYAFVG